METMKPFDFWVEYGPEGKLQTISFMDISLADALSALLFLKNTEPCDSEPNPEARPKSIFENPMLTVKDYIGKYPVCYFTPQGQYFEVKTYLPKDKGWICHLMTYTGNDNDGYRWYHADDSIYIYDAYLTLVRKEG